MVVTITGPNDFARKHELDAVVRAFVQEHGDMALERLDGEEVSAERMREAVESLPFLTPRKMVVLREPGRQKSWAEHIVDVLKNMPETTDLVIIEPKLDKRLTYYKTLKKSTDFREFGELDANGLARWAQEYAKGQGGSLSPADARLLIGRLGPNQQMMRHELDKLLAYSSQITRQSIETLVEPLPQSTVFELLDAAFQGKAARALELYHEQRAMKVEPQAIVAMLAWQLHVLAVVKTASNLPPEAIAKEAKLNPFVVRKSLDTARRLSLPALRQKVGELLEIDISSKTSATDTDEALQLFILKLAKV